MNIDSNKIRLLRKERNWSQEKLSEKCGLSPRTIQRIEGGNKSSQESIRLLAIAFEVDTKTLLLIEKQKIETPFDSVKTTLLESTNFSGKSSRSEYWWFVLFLIVILAVASIIHEKAYQILGVLFLIPFMAVGSRRLNDVGRSRWWQLLLLVPFGQVVVFYFMTLAESDKKNNNL